MAEPVSRFRTIPLTTTAAAIDSASERLASITDQAVVSTGSGNEADFGTVDISDGAANSEVLTLLWDVTDAQGNTTVEDFLLWLPTASNGFDMSSYIKIQPLSGIDQTGASNTENYTANAVIGDYTWGNIPSSEPGSINVWPTDEATSMSLSTTSDDVVMWAMYAAIASGETTGTYSGTTSGYELQFSFKFSYS